jgi:hypothetical protein
MITNEDLVLDEAAALIPIAACRRERNIERVAADVSAIRQHVTGADDTHV